MNYPLISEYIEAIKSAEDNFEELSYLRPVLGDDGLPVMTSGNFAVVFKMKDEQSGKFYAVKCFTKEQEGRAKAYREIVKELKDVSSPYLVSIQYLEKELFVDTDQTTETEFPVLLMDWVEGKTLDKYLRENLDDKYALEMLAYRFSQLAQWLIPQPFAHGDLKPDNILVREDGTLVLVDYDGMYVPAMKGQKARELGSPDFRHPLRTENDFDEYIDDFPLTSILLSLKSISLQPCLWGKYGASDRLLFSEKDYRNISKCGLLKELFPSGDSELNVLVCLFMLAYEKSNLSDVSFRLINPIKPKTQEPIILSTEITEEDFANAWTDEYGVMYSSDKKRLLHAPAKLTHYSIRKGTFVICRSAFGRKDIISIHIPDGVTDIGNYAFYGCRSLTSIKLPDSIVKIGERAFYGCFTLTSINIPDSILRIGDAAFGFCELNYIYIPYGVTSIGDYTFSNCKSLISIHIPDSVINIGDSVFEECYNLTIIAVPIGTRRKFEEMLPYYKDIIVEQEVFHKFSTEVLDEDVTNAWVDEYGFSYSNDKTKLLFGPREIHSTYKISDYTIREGTIVICNRAFDRGGAGSLNYANIIIPERVTHIGDFAFGFQDCIKTITIPWTVVHIGINPFIGCKNLKEISILSNKYVVHEKTLYSVCKVCKEDTLIQEMKIISYFGKKHSLNLRKGIVEIGECAFEGSLLIEIKLPDSIQKIGKDAFLNCLLLEHIIVPVGELPKFKKLLPQHLHDKLIEDIDPDGFPYVV